MANISTGKEHSFALKLFRMRLVLLSHLDLARAVVRLFHPLKPSLKREAFGLEFSGPIALGPGIDEKGELYNVFTDYGFSYVETGPINASSVGNSIRYVQEHGVDRGTYLSMCIDADYNQTFSLAYDFVDMFVLNLDNCPEMIETISEILDTRLSYDSYKPIIVKVKKGLLEAELEELLNFCLMNGVDGFVVTGMSELSKVSDFTSGRTPVIFRGDIKCSRKAQELLDSGASLLEITDLRIMGRLSLVRRILRRLDNNARSAANKA